MSFNLLLAGTGFDVVMLDRRPEMVRSHVLDLEQVLEQGARGTVREGTDDDVAEADILVVTAAPPLTVNDSRMVYLEGNARIVRSVVDSLPHSWAGVLLIVTNPVDPLCTLLEREAALDRRRCSATRATTRYAFELASAASSAWRRAVSRPGPSASTARSRCTCSPQINREAMALLTGPTGTAARSYKRG